MLDTMGQTTQNMTALAKANHVRLARAALKHRVADGEAEVAAVLLDPPLEAETMAISDLLMAQHRWGLTRARRFLAAVPMSENKTVGSMTDRQRLSLVARLRGDAPPRTPFDPWAPSW